jgi:hypothetical protein
MCLALLAGCQESGPASEPAPAAAPQGTAAQPTKAPGFAPDAFKPPAKPVEGEPVPESRLLTLLPEQLDGFVPDGEATGRRVNVPNSGALTTVKRTYKKDAASLELEIIDSLHSPNIRSIVKLSAQIETDTPTVVRKPTKVGEHLAIAQWHQATGTARVGVLVDDRFILNFNLKPATAPDPALELAKKYDFAPVTEMAKQAAAELGASKTAQAAAPAATTTPTSSAPAQPAPAAPAAPTTGTAPAAATATSH